MAFDIPDHLPRGGLPQDKPTQVLTKIGQTTQTTLNASLAASWLDELDSSIQATKSRISRRIHDDIPTFERQFQSSTSIQKRLFELSTTVDELTDSLHNPKTGVLPVLLQKLTAHEILSAQTHDSEVINSASEHLLRIRSDLYDLSEQAQQGQLPESAQACVRLQKLISGAPDPLNRANIMTDIQKKYRTLSDRLQEQLNDAYARSVRFSSSDTTVTLTILSSASVPPTSTVISLSAILQSLTPDSLSTYLSSFRRDLMAKFVEVVLLSMRPISVTASGSSSSLSLSLSETSSTPLQSLRTLMTFLNSHFFPHLPPAQTSFPTSLHAPITNAILIHLLEPSIPSSLPALPSFLDTVDEAINFEDSLLPMSTREKPIRHWVNDVAGHYEKKRRENFLRQVKEVTSGPEDGLTLRIEASGSSARESTSMDAWDIKDRMTQNLTVAPILERARLGHSGNAHTLIPGLQNQESPRDEEDSSDAWGWGDEDDGEEDKVEPSQDDLPQTEAQKPDADDPWDDDGWSTGPVPPPPQEPEPEREPPGPILKKTPRVATRLEKFSAKAKAISTPNTPIPTYVPTDGSPGVLQVAETSPLQQTASRSQVQPQRPQKEQVTYFLVSQRARKVLEIAEGVMREGQEVMNSNVFAKHPSTKTPVPGQLLMAAAPLMLDLHRALYPVAHSILLLHDPNIALRWSNDCKYLSSEVEKLCHRYVPASKERWLDTAERLKTLGELCYEDAVERQEEAMRDTSVGSTGFDEVFNGERLGP